MVFFDRDATLVVGTPLYDRVDSVDKVEVFPDTIEALQHLANHGYKAIIVTNQAGIAEGLISEKEFWEINDRVLELVAPSGLEFLRTYMSPHGWNVVNDWRKPGPGMLLQAAKDFDLDLSEMYMVGDRRSDVTCGINAGTKTILVQTGEPNVQAPEADYTARNLLDAAEYIVSH